MAELDRELETYRKKLPELVADEGKFVVIGGEDVVGQFVSYEDALQAGYNRFGLTPFLVKRISATEQVAFFSRDLGAKCPA